MKAKLGAVCAVIGIMAASSAMTEASAYTVSGYFTFVAVGQGVTYSGGTNLSTATSVTFPTTEYVNFIPSTNLVDGVANDFASGLSWSFSNFATVTLSTGTLSTVGGFVNIPSFLTFAANSFLGTGTTPADRFTYDMVLTNWTSSAANELTLTSQGFVYDAVGAFYPTPAELSISLTSNCGLKPCNAAAGTWVFSAEGTGGNSLIPEPVSMSLLGAGLAGLAVARRRRG